jgi:hypothetical protein
MHDDEVSPDVVEELVVELLVVEPEDVPEDVDVVDVVELDESDELEPELAESSPPQAATVTAVPALARNASARRRPINLSLITPRSWTSPRSWSSQSCCLPPGSCP